MSIDVGGPDPATPPNEDPAALVFASLAESRIQKALHNSSQRLQDVPHRRDSEAVVPFLNIPPSGLADLYNFAEQPDEPAELPVAKEISTTDFTAWKASLFEQLRQCPK